MIALRARPSGAVHLVDAATARAANQPIIAPSWCGKVPRQGWTDVYPLATEPCQACLDAR